jgi:hypothetical protein
MGRNAIYLAIGFTILCLVSGLNLSQVSVTAFQNALTYQENTNIHNIAEAGTNFACNQIFTTPNWRTGFQNVPLGGGTFSVSVNTVVNGTDSSRIQIVTGAAYQNLTDTIKILLQPSLFSKFAYFCENEPSGIYWATGDTVWGPYHSNTKLYVDGNPVFNGKVTTLNGLSEQSGSHPLFNGGYQSGISITMPTSLSNLQAKAQQAGGGFYSATSTDFYLTFNSNGTVTYRSGTSGAWTTQSLTSFAGTNKVVVINGANIHVKGVLSGQVTIAALSSNTSNGMVWIDSSVSYNNNPLTNPSSTDMLGICATNNIMITSNANNNNPAKGVTIQASMFSQNGGFGADSATTKVPSGAIHLLGGISQDTRQAVGVVGGTHGYSKSYYYDTRMLVTAPPCFPTTGSYEVLEWWE